ncbi:MAG: hypothetical protein HC846_00935 [Blastocatellia bacterium]|nr:hypothetical protein [Blastocatellia bacterium]
MKITLTFIVICLFFINSIGQSKTISRNEYEQVFRFAVSETNADFPFIFKVSTESIENGKTVRKVIEINERESPGHERIKRTVITQGQETNILSNKKLDLAMFFVAVMDCLGNLPNTSVMV